MNLGNVFLPLTLFAAAAYQPLKYFMSVPALCVQVALVIVLYGVYRSSGGSDESRAVQGA